MASGLLRGAGAAEFDRAIPAGRSRQALRTSLRRAERAGLHAHVLAPRDRAAAVAAFEQAYVGRRPARGAAPPVIRFPAEVEAPFTRWVSVTDEAGHVLGIAYAVLGGRTALLRLLVSTGDPHSSHGVRYVLHVELVRALMEARVQHVVVEGLLASPSGLRYFAARLGFRACRLSWSVDAQRSTLTVVRPVIDLRDPVVAGPPVRLDDSQLA